MINFRKYLIGRVTNSIIRRKRAFTLIESLAVIAIIGILLSLGTYIFTQAASQARDAKRKSDLDQIAQAFNARFLDKTCTNQAAVGRYPGEGLEQLDNQKWIKVNSLKNYTDPAPMDCNSFSQYLPTIPDDPRTPTFTYYFNLSQIEVSGSQQLPALAKHYRLTTALEHQFSVGSVNQLECVRLSHVWINSFGGQPYDCDQHVITLKTPWPVLVAASSYCSINPDGTVNYGNPPGCIDPGGGTGGGGGGSGGGGGGTGGGGTTTSGPYNYYIGQ